MDNNNQQLTTPAVNLLVPADRFTSASRLYGRLHRWRVLLGKYWLVLVLIVPSVVVPVWYLTFSSPPSYESKARMWLTGKLDIREGRLYTEELIDYLATQAELLRSPVIQNRAFTRLVGSTTNLPESLKSGRAMHFEVLDEAKALLKKLSPPQASTADPEALPPVPFKVKVSEASKSSTLELRAVGADPFVATRCSCRRSVPAVVETPGARCVPRRFGLGVLRFHRGSVHGVFEWGMDRTTGHGGPSSTPPVAARR
jgi:hypothetical protein